jgi:hypothetical protein
LTLKSTSNQKPGYYAMYPCTYDKNLEMIQPLAQELYQFLVLAPGGQAKNQTGPKFGL